MAHEKISGDTLFYFQKRTPEYWHDETVGKLTPEDIDSNFYTLKSMDIKDVTFNNGILSFTKYDCEQSFDVDLNMSEFATKEEVSSTVNTAVSLLRNYINEQVGTLSDELSAVTSGLSAEIQQSMDAIDAIQEKIVSAFTIYDEEISDFESGVDEAIAELLNQFNDFKSEVNQRLRDFEREFPKICTVTITTNDANAGVVHGDGNYVKGMQARLIAEPNEGYLFFGWDEGGVRCADWAPEFSNPLYLTVTKNKSLTALFGKKIPVTVESNTPDYGFIELTYYNHDTVVSDNEIVYYVPEGCSVKLKATAFGGMQFVGWSNGETSEEITLTPTEQTNIRAIFEVTQEEQPTR